MSKIVYEMFETENNSEGLGKMLSFGIRAMDEERCVASFADVCSNREQIEALAMLCTVLELDPRQLGEVVDDFIFDMVV